MALLPIAVLPYHFTAGYSYFVDYTARLNINDNPLGTYYFWWTNQLYLPLFFFTLILVAAFGAHSASLKLCVLLAFLLEVLYPTELWDYLSMSATPLIPSYVGYGANSLLTNALNRYHPLIFYASATIFITTALHLVKPLLTKKPFSKLSSSVTQNWTGWVAVLVNLVALWKGSWWALQEGTWGGWWNWDTSEVFGLLVTVLILTLLHARTTLMGLISTFQKFVALQALFLLSYFFIQLNFDLVSHNFGAKFFFFFNNNLFFLEAVFFLLVLILYTCYVSLFKRLASVVGIKQLADSSVVRMLPAVVATSWVLWSYKPLVNYFLWNFLEVNIFNVEVSLQPIHTTILLVFLVWLLGSLGHTALLTLILVFYTSHWAFIALFFTQALSRTALLHTTLAFFTLLNVILLDLFPIQLVTTSNYGYLSSSFRCLFEGCNILVLDGTSIELVKTHRSVSLWNSSNWNITSIPNTATLNFFSLVASAEFFQNCYKIGMGYIDVHLVLELPLLGTLNFLFVLLLCVTLLVAISGPKRPAF